MKPDVRLMTDADLIAADQLRAAAGWNQLTCDWQRLLEYEPQGCFVAEVDGQLAGTVTTTCYGSVAAWIGMMLVHPDRRRRGIGRQLMETAFDSLRRRQVATVMLDATPAGHPLYAALGFADEWEFHRWSRPADQEAAAADASITPHTSVVHPGTTAVDLADHRGMDCEAFGTDRWAWIERLAGSGTAITCVNGYAMLRPGVAADYLGPVVATSSETAENLITRLLATTGRQVFWDVPGPNSAATDLAQRLDFQPVRTLTRMRLGSVSLPADTALQYAIADPGTG